MYFFHKYQSVSFTLWAHTLCNPCSIDPSSRSLSVMSWWPWRNIIRPVPKNHSGEQWAVDPPAYVCCIIWHIIIPISLCGIILPSDIGISVLYGASIRIHMNYETKRKHSTQMIQDVWSFPLPQTFLFTSLDATKKTKCCLACSGDKILLSLNKLIFQLFMLHSTRFTIAMINHDLGCPTCSTNLKQGRLWTSPWQCGHEPVFHGIVIPSSSSLDIWNQGSIVTWQYWFDSEMFQI